MHKLVNSVVIMLVIAATIFVFGCHQAVEAPHESAVRQVSVEDAKNAAETEGTQFIDVRTQAEFDAEHAAKSVNFPLDSIDSDAAKLDKSKPVYIICQTGRRSQIAAAKLNELGFSDVANVQGGMNAWTKAGLPTVKK